MKRELLLEKIEDKKTKEVRCLTSNEAMLETYETVKDYSDNFSLELWRLKQKDIGQKRSFPIWTE